MEKYDLCIIGGGPAGYAAAMRAIDFDKKVVLIEKDKLGGAAVYNGALSSKTMWEMAMKTATVRSELRNVSGSSLIEWETVLRTVEAATFEKKYQLFCHVKLLQTISNKKCFTYKRGKGTLLSSNEVCIEGEQKKAIIYADNIIISTGSTPRKLIEIPIDEDIILTSDGIGQLKDFPKSLVVLGAGVIGCEFATIFSHFGRTKVYLIDKEDRILPFEDEDIVNMVASNFEQQGITIHKNSKLESMKTTNGMVEYELSYTDGKREKFTVEKALIAVGRIPNTKEIGLEKIGIELTPQGYIKEENTRTHIPTIYAIGDTTRQMALVNVGEMQARYAVEIMYGEKDPKKLQFHNVSTIMFLNPEVAGVGMNELQAMTKNIPFRVACVDYSCISRAIAMRKTQGFFKILVTDNDEMKILGMRALGEHASSAIQAVALLMHLNQGIASLADVIHPHPSIIEGIQEAARMLMGKSVYKASVFGDKLKCYRWVNGEKTPLKVY
jgi:dihydrolipoamide dehydrogenase